MERKLTAILSADVKGYSRLMGEDEEATIRTLTAYRRSDDYAHPAASRPGGRFARAITCWPSLPAWWMPCNVRSRFNTS